MIRPEFNVQVRRVSTASTPRSAPATGVSSRLEVMRGDDDKGLLHSIRKGVRWLINGPTVDSFKSYATIADPDTRWASDKATGDARSNVRAQAGAETAAVAKLGARAEAYRVLAGLCADDPIARDALMRMLLDGRLTRRDLAGTRDMMDHLAKLASAPLATGVNRAALVTALIEEAEEPTKIAQEAKGTCVATSSTIYLARKNPAEYVRLVAELAQPAGVTTTANGTALQRNRDWTNDNDNGRTPSVRLLQPALMELGNGKVLRYNNGGDFHTLEANEPSTWQKFRDWLSGVKVLPGGLSVGGAHRILEALTGERFGKTTVTRLNRESAFRNVEAAVKAGKTVPVGLEWEGGGHKVLLDKIEGGKAYLTNPWGQKDTISVEEFKSNLMDANIPR